MYLGGPRSLLLQLVGTDLNAYGVHGQREGLKPTRPICVAQMLQVFDSWLLKP